MSEISSIWLATQDVDELKQCRVGDAAWAITGRDTKNANNSHTVFTLSAIEPVG